MVLRILHEHDRRDDHEKKGIFNQRPNSPNIINATKEKSWSCLKLDFMKKKRWCGLHSAGNLPHLPILLLKACGVGSNWRRAGNNQLLTKAACGQAAGAISGRSLIRTHCIPPFSFPLYPAVFHTLTLIIPHCMYTFYIFSYTLILFSHYSGFY